MKILVEIDGWMQTGEDESDGIEIDDLFKQRVMEAIVNRVAPTAEKKIQALVGDRVNALIDEKINSVLADFLNRAVVLTDRYGDPKEQFESVMEMIKNRFDEYIDAEVDKEGKPVEKGCGYNNKKRINYLIETEVQKRVDPVVKDIHRTVEVVIQSKFTAAIKNSIAQEIVSKMDLSTLNAKPAK
jgi:hypothetical protein